MYWRAVVIWLLQLAFAVVNGVVREGVLLPYLGPGTGHVVSTFFLCAAILIITLLTIGWIAPATTASALRLGLLWVGLTLAFEFGAGHYLFGHPWERLLADYDVAAGRIWPLVLVTTLLAPVLARRLGRG
jgi:hypothetical protein